MKSRYYKLITLAALLTVNACNYLDVTPDNIATIDQAFDSRIAAEKYLYTCYYYRPSIGDLYNDPAMCGADESWQFYPITTVFGIYTGSNIGRGFQNSNDPYLNYWDGTRGGKSLWQGIRDCNIFLENIGRVMDIQEYERTRWIAEVKFLKAYYHYYLFKCYGPIPITDVNLPVSASPDEVRVRRNTVDEVVEYISSLILEAVEDLPTAGSIVEGTEAGRIDKLSALSIRAELLLFAASPLFNGNTDYKGHPVGALFNQTEDAGKWDSAAKACKELIDACHAGNKALYNIVDPYAANAPEQLKLQTVYRQAVCDMSWNKELIWGGTNYNWTELSRASHPRSMQISNSILNEVNSQWAPTMKAVEAYYSSNGVPIDEDREWNSNGWYANRYSVREQPAGGDEVYFVKENENTAYLHYNREPRFYASIGFDRGIYYGSGHYDFPNDVMFCKFINFEYSGFQGGSQYSPTGYASKKTHNFKCGLSNSSFSIEPFPFPIMRLANIYLMYAEALNESGGPSDEVFKYLDLVRARAGLKGVRESWRDHSSRPEKPNGKDGLREIIRRERTIELAFEGKRFWDLRRWKMIGELNNQPQGWNVRGENREDFYKVVPIAQTPVNFTVKDYFWPIRESSLVVNNNLMQNYGW